MVYTITAFSDRGETLLDDTFDASSDSEARQEGIRRLKEANLATKILAPSSLEMKPASFRWK